MSSRWILSRSVMTTVVFRPGVFWSRQKDPGLARVSGQDCIQVPIGVTLKHIVGILAVRRAVTARAVWLAFTAVGALRSIVLLGAVLETVVETFRNGCSHTAW